MSPHALGKKAGTHHTAEQVSGNWEEGEGPGYKLSPHVCEMSGLNKCSIKPFKKLTITGQTRQNAEIAI